MVHVVDRVPSIVDLAGQEIDHQDSRLAKNIETLKRWKQLGERSGELLALDTNTFLPCRPYNETPWTELAVRTKCAACPSTRLTRGHGQ
jgi:hypothetical protein